MKPEDHVVVVGAGPAGVAAALALKDAGMSAVVLDRADRVASSWRSRYDSLRLNTWRPFSHLPGRPYPKGAPTFPSRDELIAHVERHAGEDGMELRLGERRAGRAGRRRLGRPSGGELRAPQVIVATGLDQPPSCPTGPGARRSRRELTSLLRVPEPGAVRGEAGARGGAGKLGNRDRPRADGGRRGDRLAGCPHPAQPPAATGARARAG